MAKLAGSIKAWASNPVHLVGDYPGDDTKVDGGDGVINAGLIPGDVFAPTAEETNYEFGRWTSVLQWVQDGTSASVATAGIVERSATGQINAERLIILNTQGQSGIDSTGNNGEYGVIGRSTRTGVQGIATSGAFPALLGTHQGTGPGVQGTSVGGYGGRFTGGAAQAGVRTDGSGAGSPGLEANGTGGQPDILLTPADNYGVDIQCGAGALGGIRVLSNGQIGLYIIQDDPNYEAATLFGDSAAATGVGTLYTRAFGSGDALQTIANTSNGYCIRMTPKSAAPQRGSIFNAGQAARPTDVTDGQLTRLSVENQWAMSSFIDFDDGGWRGFLTTIGGSALGYSPPQGQQASGALNAWIDSALCSASGGNKCKVGGRAVMMRISCSARSNTANALSRLSLQLVDLGPGGGVVWTRSGLNGWSLPNPGAVAPLGEWVSIYAEIAVTVPSAGDRNWRLQFATSLNALVIRDACVAFGPGMT